MFIEDFINRLASDGPYLFAGGISLHSMDVSIISSLSSQIVQGKGFTEKQSHLAVRFSKKYSKQLSIAFNKDITAFIDKPEFKLPIRVISSSRSISIRKIENAKKQVISISFPYDETIIGIIRGYKKLLSTKSHLGNGINWNADNGSWDFDLREEHVEWINNNIINSSFVADDLFLKFVKQINYVQDNLENYIPIIKFENNKFVYKNVPDSVPQPDTYDIVNVLIEGRKYGITTWTDDIDIVLGQLNLNPVLYNFLTSSDFTGSINEKEKLTIQDIGSIVKHSLPCLVVIPGGAELKNLEKFYNLFIEEGIPPEEMTVLFRLGKDQGAECNDFVKTHKLNNPINDKNKIVFISGKVPKPIIEAKMQFSSILNLGISGVHYTLSGYIKNHHFVINYIPKG